MESYINNQLRTNLWEHFPDLIFFDSPVSDEAIVGLGLINDEEPCWAVVYDQNTVLRVMSEYFSDNGSNDEESDPELEALEWFDFNVIGGYVGASTPIFMLSEEDEYIASRFSHLYDKYFNINHVNSLEEAFEKVKNEDQFMFVPLQDINRISELSSTNSPVKDAKPL
jgi:hypothetical protein